MSPFWRPKTIEIFKKFCPWNLKQVDLQIQVATSTELEKTQNIYYDTWLDLSVHLIENEHTRFNKVIWIIIYFQDLWKYPKLISSSFLFLSTLSISLLLLASTWTAE